MTRSWQVLVFSIIALGGCGNNVPPLLEVTREMLSDAEAPDTYGALLPEINDKLLAQFDFQILYVDVPSLRDETLMRPFEKNGEVETWMGPQGRMLSIVDGVVHATRGYGHDLAASQRPNLPDILSYARRDKRYGIIYRHWNDEEELTTRNGYCDPRETPAGVEEHCFLGELQFTNRYELGSDGIKVSQQWVSPERGYLRTIRLK